MEKYCIRKADLNDLEEIAELEQFCPYIIRENSQYGKWNGNGTSQKIEFLTVEQQNGYLQETAV